MSRTSSASDRTERIAADLYRLRLPLPGNPLGDVNAFALVCEDGVRLVDSGWDDEQVYESLAGQLESLGASIADVREVLVTHIHPDHFGLAKRIASEAGARILMHHLDARHVLSRYHNADGVVRQMQDWLVRSGVPASELDAMARSSLQMLQRVGDRQPDVELVGGEVLEWGDRSLEVVWTPGHSEGLICLWDAEAGIVFSTDHVLEKITPHVGLHVESQGDPLGDYLNSLRRIAELPARTVLPGHGPAFNNLTQRALAIIGHHRQRMDEMKAVIAGQPSTPYEVARAIPWMGSAEGWERLGSLSRRMAVTETAAHLALLAREAEVVAIDEGGQLRYALS